MPKQGKKRKPRKKYHYDVALSFAGENRKYVQQVADILTDLGIRVFYDEYEKSDLWGKDLVAHLDDVYRHKARFCLMFISKYYAKKLWTTHERKSATARAFRARVEYILPARFDDTDIPGLPDTTGYIDLRKTTAEELADLVLRKTSRKREINAMLAQLKSLLPDEYQITVEGSEVRFVYEEENYEGSFSLRLLLEMYRLDELDHMFVQPAIVPY